MRFQARAAWNSDASLLEVMMLKRCSNGAQALLKRRSGDRIGSESTMRPAMR